MGECCKEEAMLAGIAVRALSPSDEGWAATNPDSVVVNELSKGGGKRGARVFKLTPGTEGDVKPSPSAVVLHYGPAINSEHFIMRKAASATELFSQAGISPPRLATGDNWYIEEWWDNDENQGWTQAAEKWVELGCLTAKMHAIPSDWFWPFQKEALSQHPWLGEVPDASAGGSRVWLYSTSPMLPVEKDAFSFLVENNEFRSEFCEFNLFGPKHDLASRLVTSHHDFHTLNIINRGDLGLCIIDLETVGVDLAIHDITTCLASCEWNVKKSRAFLEGYLEGSCEEVTETAITALLLDAHLFAAYSMRVWLNLPGFLGMTSDEAKERLGKWKAYAKAVRDSAAEQAILLETGPEASFSRMGLI